MIEILIVAIVALIASSGFASAMCPLCTAGAGLAAFGAEKLGMNPVAVALFIGGFAMSTGLWMARIIKKKFFRFQDFIIITAIFLLTLVPIIAITGAKLFPFYLSWFGSYGSLFNRTYMINGSLISGLFGGLLVWASPKINQKLKSLRKGKGVPFQGVIITLLMLISVGAVIQLILG